MWIKVLGLVLVVLALAVVIHRLLEYRRLEPMREGISALKAGDYRLAMNRLRPFAESGDVLAQKLLGDIYAYGLGLPMDNVQARIWYRLAECGCESTGSHEYFVAINYLEGSAPGDQKQNLQLAANWLQLAAEAGYTEAQRTLANPVSLAAKGLSIDHSVSEYWQRKTQMR
jgi:TPR repeat protein